jgi:hypothetical protein
MTGIQAFECEGCVRLGAGDVREKGAAKGEGQAWLEDLRAGKKVCLIVLEMFWVNDVKPPPGHFKKS